MLCRVEEMQVGSGSGNVRNSRVGSVQVESGNVNKKLLHSLLPALFNAYKSAHWRKFKFKNSPNTVNHCSENTIKAKFGLSMPYYNYVMTESTTLMFAKKLPTLGICCKAIPDPEPTLPEGLLPDLPDPTRGIDTSIFCTEFGPGWIKMFYNSKCRSIIASWSGVSILCT